jgi:hypothetical protein
MGKHQLRTELQIAGDRSAVLADFFPFPRLVVPDPHVGGSLLQVFRQLVPAPATVHVRLPSEQEEFHGFFHGHRGYTEERSEEKNDTENALEELDGWCGGDDADVKSEFRVVSMWPRACCLIRHGWQHGLVK